MMAAIMTTATTVPATVPAMTLALWLVPLPSLSNDGSLPLLGPEVLSKAVVVAKGEAFACPTFAEPPGITSLRAGRLLPTMPTVVSTPLAVSIWPAVTKIVVAVPSEINSEINIRLEAPILVAKPPSDSNACVLVGAPPT